MTTPVSPSAPIKIVKPLAQRSDKNNGFDNTNKSIAVLSPSNHFQLYDSKRPVRMPATPLCIDEGERESRLWNRYHPNFKTEPSPKCYLEQFFSNKARCMNPNTFPCNAVSSLVCTKFLGIGAHGRVDQCECTNLLFNNSVQFAQKKLSNPKKATFEAMRMVQLQKIGITKLYNTQCRGGEKDSEYILYMPLIPTILDKSTGRRSVEECHQIARQILIQLQKMHRIGLLHNDIKPSNIGQKSDKSWTLLDFGNCSRPFPHVIRFPMGTPDYMPPEILEGNLMEGATAEDKAVYDYKSEVWSLAVALWETYTDLEWVPKEYSTHRDALDQIRMRLTNWSWETLLREQASLRGELEQIKPLQQFLNKVFTSKPEDRPTVAQALKFFEPHDTSAPAEKKSDT